MKILIACEYSGIIRDAFLAKGHDAMSCDLLDTESPGPHYRGDVRDVLYEDWDMMIAHPPCTYVCSSGIQHNSLNHARKKKTDEAVEFAKLFIDCKHIPKVVVENPVGVLSTRIRKPNQVIQPWMFGEDASKATCLWIKGVSRLRLGKLVKPRAVYFRDKWVLRWGNQDMYGMTVVPKGNGGKERARMFPGIAKAMAEQWG